MVIYFGLVFGIIEFVASLLFFKLFLYEEICQAGAMYCFLATNYQTNYMTGSIKSLTRYHGINPGKAVLEEYWMLAPWLKEPFDTFFQASEQCIRAFG